MSLLSLREQKAALRAAFVFCLHRIFLSAGSSDADHSKVTLKVASAAAQSREFQFAADETWGLVAGPAGIPLPLRIY